MRIFKEIIGFSWILTRRKQEEAQQKVEMAELYLGLE